MTKSKRIFVGCRVEGGHGPLVANPNPNIKRRVHSRVVGTVLKANEQHKWEVLFDFNGKVKVCSLKLLSIVPLGSGVPLHEEIQEVRKVNLSCYIMFYFIFVSILIVVVLLMK